MHCGDVFKKYLFYLYSIYSICCHFSGSKGEWEKPYVSPNLISTFMPVKMCARDSKLESDFYEFHFVARKS